MIESLQDINNYYKDSEEVPEYDEWDGKSKERIQSNSEEFYRENYIERPDGFSTYIGADPRSPKQ